MIPQTKFELDWVLSAGPRVQQESEMWSFLSKPFLFCATHVQNVFIGSCRAHEGNGEEHILHINLSVQQERNQLFPLQWMLMKTQPWMFSGKVNASIYWLNAATQSDLHSWTMVSTSGVVSEAWVSCNPWSGLWNLFVECLISVVGGGGLHIPLV